MIKRKIVPAGISKAQIVEEYLSGESSYKELSKKYGVHDRTIQSWVRTYRKKNGELSSSAAQLKEKELNEEVDRLKLKVELLEEIIDLSEKKTGVPLRKKFGPKQ